MFLCPLYIVYYDNLYVFYVTYAMSIVFKMLHQGIQLLEMHFKETQHSVNVTVSEWSCGENFGYKQYCQTNLMLTSLMLICSLAVVL